MKRISIIFLFVALTLFKVSAQVLTPSENKDKLFFYASELPEVLKPSSSLIRKHIIDIVLLTESYNIMLSRIPDELVKAKAPQFILKYKLRTMGKNLYSIELFLINADYVRIERSRLKERVPLHNLTASLRQFTLEFLKNSPLSKTEEKKLAKRNTKMIQKIGKIENKIEMHSLAQSVKDSLEIEKNKQDLSDKKSNISKIHPPQNMTIRNPKEKKSLWDLLKDQDKDIPWSPEKPIAKATIHATADKRIAPFFDWIKIQPSMAQYQELEFNRFHASYKYAQRSLEIQDIINLNTDYTSVIGFAFEWLKYYPKDVSRKIFKLALEFDSPLETTPVQLEGHFNLKASLAYRITNKLTLGVSYDIDKLNYPNLNQVGTDIVANSYTIYWLGIEGGYFHRDFNTTLALETLYSAKNSSEITTAEERAKEDFNGHAIKYNLRYYFNDLFFEKIQFWIGFQARYYNLSRKNKIIGNFDENKTTNIKAINYIFHTGVYF